ncbi:FAD/NAD(P)-binding domain-containing protein [Mycena belliarum]|uniref:FAD/NAD(P)-binding domain-containing protein n=1 Tax=Mycena belliarum TaxID=1033014 RepID=A0AAD6XJJ6_9AGAR|nr:FAD/NAD(P)-binding domain-containing protein [Mycena belliae]
MGSDNSPLNIAIVGAGIAGLTSAIALRQNGHYVQIYEAAELKTEGGAALSLQVNSLRVLAHLGVSIDNFLGVNHTGHIAYDAETGEGKTFGSATLTSQAGLMCHRSDIWDELKRVALGEGKGLPVKIHLGGKVIACDANEGKLTLSTGESVHADLVLGADGINSVIRTEILGGAVAIPPSELSCFRALLEAQDVPELDWYTNGISGFRIALSNEGPFRIFICYPCRSGRLVNFVGVFTDSSENEAACTRTGTMKEILATFHGFHRKFLRLLDLPLHSAITKWKLHVVPPLPTWIRGRTALLGDSAHGTLPFLGQGAGMAIEEAGVLGCLLPHGTSREDVPARLEAYYELRSHRGNYMSSETVRNFARMKGGTAGFSQPQLGQVHAYLRDYDAIKAAQEVYEKRFI